MPHNDAPHGGEQSPARKSTWEREQEVLETLRTSVMQAVEEIARLRAENVALSERLDTLSTASVPAAGEVALAFSEPPEVLREKVQGFIDAIDAYLETYAASTEPAS